MIVFLPQKKILHLFVIGTGLIGGALLEQIKNQWAALKEDQTITLRIIGIMNSQGMILNPNGIDLSAWKQTLSAEGLSSSLSTMIETIRSLNLPSSVLVDCTASEEIAAKYEEILKCGISIVTPNKKANSGSLARYQTLKKTAKETGTWFLYQTTVGGGLPIISTLRDLIASGDRITSIEGVLSGTLSWLFTPFTAGTSFGALVKKAKDKGYTEPDPRDDLSHGCRPKTFGLGSRSWTPNGIIRYSGWSPLFQRHKHAASIENFGNVCRRLTMSLKKEEKNSTNARKKTLLPCLAQK